MRFSVESGACRLEARSYPPMANAHPGRGVVLLHGLLSSADVWDVPGLESMSVARGLQREGIHVVTYDQRGSSSSTTDGWQFGLREHALVDLPIVLAECRRRFGFEQIVLVGHSLGGTIWLRYLQSLGDGPMPDPHQPTVVGGVAVASPADFDRRFPPWSDIARRGRAFAESIDHNRDAIVTPDEFVGAQVTLYWPWAAVAVRPAGVRAGMRLASRSVFWASVMRRLPIPTLIYHRDDFDSPTFQRVLQSKTLDRGPHALLMELVDQVLADPVSTAHSLPLVPLSVLCIGSGRDRLVPLRTVEGLSRRFTKARLVATETEYGQVSGHVGYFFKAGLRERVFGEILGYIRSIL